MKRRKPKFIICFLVMQRPSRHLCVELASFAVAVALSALKTVKFVINTLTARTEMMKPNAVSTSFKLTSSQKRSKIN